MNKKFVVRLSEDERAVCQEIVKNLKGSSQKFRRAQILLKADADGPAWSDVKIAEAFSFGQYPSCRDGDMFLPSLSRRVFVGSSSNNSHPFDLGRRQPATMIIRSIRRWGSASARYR